MARAICFRNSSRVGSRIVGGLGFRLKSSSSSEPPASVLFEVLWLVACGLLGPLPPVM